MSEAIYDRLGRGYTTARRADPVLAAAIRQQLGDASSVVKVGAGTGSYEPADREVVAVEPSSVMIAQRQPGAATVVQAEAERLPFADDSFDVAMAVLSDHHWHDRGCGLRELRRVARRRVLLFNADPAEAQLFWLTRDYLPGFVDLIPPAQWVPGTWLRELADALGRVEPIAVPIPHDCADGFYGAWWRRPWAYLDADVRAGISVFAKLAPDDVEAGLQRLRDDLRTGRWHRRHGDLLDRSRLHLGYHVLVADLNGDGG